mmetsp:Transcript_22273/g.56861  ORF Transcript_22273/g.56861 Transcript_22273/m.56861 type:complete len:396 (+) Transcript_22273:150-1337(+)
MRATRLPPVALRGVSARLFSEASAKTGAAAATTTKTDTKPAAASASATTTVLPKGAVGGGSLLGKVTPPPMTPPPNLGHIHEFKPTLTVIGVGGAGGNAVNNMIARGLKGVDFVVANTDAQHLATCLTDNRIQMGKATTQGLGCGANPDAGKEAALESLPEIMDVLDGSHMVFITAGMGGGTGTGAAPVIAEACLDANMLTVGVATQPFTFEGKQRARLAHEGLELMQHVTDSLIVVPNQNLFHLIDEKTSLDNAFRLADDVLLGGVRSVTDLMVLPGLINLDFADVTSVMKSTGNAIMGSGQAEGEDRAIKAAVDALTNPLLGELTIKSAKGLLVNITGGSDITLFELDRAAQKITDEIDDEFCNIIIGGGVDPALEGQIRVSIVATGIEEKLF